ncbi:hypothetical protein [Comamonas sp. NLF-1-9]|uniref:hypothetical protein n=1 Tax=Comamonas sp. NLF-1-9 TaxID=2853163 RepID=UPI001C47DADB|nr:hypothetical protein [Comamonas sp. NLF-1-9]QXL84562.1 hypothetical protein KUD94_00745 [Comamonas sp. NLF-1-9]
MKRWMGMVAVAALAGAGGAGAQTIYGQLGTTGATVGYAQHFEGFNLRADLNFLSYGRNIHTRHIDYDGKLKFSSVGLFGDYFLAGQFRLTGGFFLGRDKIAVDARAESILPGEWVRGDIHTRNLRPYLGVGWGYSPKASGLSFAADLGASYGAVRTSLQASPGMGWTQGRLDQERAALDDKASKYKWFPVVRVGLAYRF